MILDQSEIAANDSMRWTKAILGVSLKMYLDQHETLKWCRRVAEIAGEHPAVVDGNTTLVVLPTFPAIGPAVEIFAGTRVQVGAQNLFWENRGAFTGEVSGSCLEQIGCSYVEIGHSERRRIFAEGNDIVALKFAAALRNNLVPIVCVGESTRAGAADAASTCIAQLEAALRETPPAGSRIVAAYEPGWAIGAARPAPVEHITFVCDALKEWFTDREVLLESQVIYGGSAGPGLLGLLGQSVDGLFLGRSMHDPEALVALLDEVLRLDLASADTN